MFFRFAGFVLLLVVTSRGQRPSFAGLRPIGYPELYDKSTTPANELGNRFGEGENTTQHLPIEANGDKELVDTLSKLPIDQQPFWLINWNALEENRKKPQTYPLTPNVFVQSNAEIEAWSQQFKNPTSKRSSSDDDYKPHSAQKGSQGNRVNKQDADSTQNSNSQSGSDIFARQSCKGDKCAHNTGVQGHTKIRPTRKPMANNKKRVNQGMDRKSTQAEFEKFISSGFDDPNDFNERDNDDNFQ